MKKITFNYRNAQTQELDPLQGYEIKLDGIILGAYKKNGNWVLYELRSGFVFLEAEKPKESLKSCINRAKERLEKFGVNEVNRRIELAVAKFAVLGEANETNV